MARFNQEHIELWHRDGVVVIEKFFQKDEISVIASDFIKLYGERGLKNPKLAPLKGTEYKTQFEIIDVLPYSGTIDLNLISLHPELISLAKSLLQVDFVHMYQSHTWAKFTGLSNYDQGFHCDFGNHTLTVPSIELTSKTVNFIIYVSDVTNELGPFQYVTKPESEQILGQYALQQHALWTPKDDSGCQKALKSVGKSVIAPSGSLIVYGLDVFHRGTNLTQAFGSRYSMTVSYKAAGNDAIGFHVWQQQGERNWGIIMEHATPEQLNCLGVPLPGSSFWNQTTIAQTRERWPNWDSSLYESEIL